jgi:ribosomal protein S18 acetylase RimI-like enzyme
MEIRLATNNDINRIIEITNACAKHMISQNIFQWNEQYPNKEIFSQDVLNECLFVMEIKDVVIGCICISSEMDEVYKNVKWLTKNKKNIYLHRLAVHPTFQGKGYAISLMNYAEQLALKKEYESIRLDTFSGNQKNNKFYKLQGYTKLEKIFFRKQSDLPFYCYEKIV